MSENTANAGHGKRIEICFGMPYTNERGEIDIPPQYAGRMQLADKDYLIIPLEYNRDNSKKKTKKANREDMVH